MRNFASLFRKICFILACISLFAVVSNAQEAPKDAKFYLQEYIKNKNAAFIESEKQNKDISQENTSEQEETDKEENKLPEKVPFYEEPAESNKVNAQQVKYYKIDKREIIDNSQKVSPQVAQKINMVTDLFKKEKPVDDVPQVPGTKNLIQNLMGGGAANPAQPAISESNITPDPKLSNPNNQRVNDWQTSLLFSSDDAFKLNEAALDFESGLGTNNSNFNNALKEVQQKKIVTSPAVFLNSIIYLAEEDWKIWINGKKYASTEKAAFYSDELSKINYINVKPTEITFILETSALSVLAPNWSRKLSQSVSGDYISADGNIRVSKTMDSVTFKLRVNQSFVLYDMSIAEGFINSKTIDNADLAKLKQTTQQGLKSTGVPGNAPETPATKPTIQPQS